jgi:mono/diheme cytochrome c family protein
LPVTSSQALAARTAAISFRKQVQPIFDANCVVCHQSGGAQAGLVLEDGKAYANLVEQRSHESPMALVKPGSAENSYLLHKINGTQAAAHGDGARMPLGGQLDSSDIDIVRAWIIAGALDN